MTRAIDLAEDFAIVFNVVVGPARLIPVRIETLGSPDVGEFSFLIYLLTVSQVIL